MVGHLYASLFPQHFSISVITAGLLSTYEKVSISCNGWTCGHSCSSNGWYDRRETGRSMGRQGRDDRSTRVSETADRNAKLRLTSAALSDMCYWNKHHQVQSYMLHLNVKVYSTQKVSCPVLFPFWLFVFLHRIGRNLSRRNVIQLFETETSQK